MSIRYAREVNPICGDWFASSATRCCFVDTGLEFRCIRRISLQQFHDPTPRFPPRGPGGSRVHASPVLSRRYDFLPSLPPHFVAFVWRYHTVRFVIRSHRPKRNFGGPGVIRVRQPPQPTCPLATTGSPKFPGNPDCRFAQVLRLRQDCTPLTVTVRQHGPRKRNSEGSYIGTFEAQ